MAKQLSVISIGNFRASTCRREIADGGCPGLYLIVQKSGQKSWALRFRQLNGKPAKLTLGRFDPSNRETDRELKIGDPLTLAGARALAAEIHRQRQRGIDVHVNQKAAKRRRLAEIELKAVNTFGRAARDFIERYARQKNRRWKEQGRLLGLQSIGDGWQIIPRSVVSQWAERPVTDITSHEIFELVNEVRERGVPGLERRSNAPTEARARVMFACLSKLFGWLTQQRRLEKSPCAGVFKPAASPSRDRVLSDSEIATFWKATTTLSDPFRAALQLLLLTGCRLNEVAGMRVSEIAEAGEIWNIPSARTKNKRAHQVAFSTFAREILASLPRDSDLLFTTTGYSPISGWSKTKVRLDVEMRIPAWRIHDLRRTVATGMAEMGVPPHIVEAALNHVSGAKAGVAGTYNRAAYRRERRIALERWGERVRRLVAQTDQGIIALDQRRRA